jgi:hypothetical protein
MQKVAAYLLERRDNVETPEARRAEFARCIDVFRGWLQSKGAAETEGRLGIV